MKGNSQPQFDNASILGGGGFGGYKEDILFFSQCAPGGGGSDNSRGMSGSFILPAFSFLQYSFSARVAPSPSLPYLSDCKRNKNLVVTILETIIWWMALDGYCPRETNSLVLGSSNLEYSAQGTKKCDITEKFQANIKKRSSEG